MDKVKSESAFFFLLVQEAFLLIIIGKKRLAASISCQPYFYWWILWSMNQRILKKIDQKQAIQFNIKIKQHNYFKHW